MKNRFDVPWKTLYDFRRNYIICHRMRFYHHTFILFDEAWWRTERDKNSGSFRIKDKAKKVKDASWDWCFKPYMHIWQRTNNNRPISKFRV